jgi:hypothetical protein
MTSTSGFGRDKRMRTTTKALRSWRYAPDVRLGHDAMQNA